ncbi:MAG: tRNA (guanine10-N2)-dimethyltransferase [Methanohalophilus sp. T328-1]|jgi:tRNA (guanine10-N2)-dimethyltransferase|uniref:tRNA (guanine(10)-N(2))-dimethyltransferase n=2 Tax=Methanohalophilus TaxID=2175 RepID=A0A285G531_9EURY|nr:MULTISPECIES: TRM11 family methyltransferase [Methanohalophilus]KXS41304.1 MAG: tRNA (guanine10-N2)-dimethyltransferase [Methanohalophilus sp. T328-1]RSD34274.1 MAG: tRNA (guanine10-N2)-dimethyltransferase [Methanohalophilus sp.]OBZ34704.1 MAG: RNA methyltransferase [Methanohalophilus sp. DAL1]ODV49743.1 MAG: tRNA (guanine10-N2)-dimethyltransferase [Methanohalophilus sp. 2-GBenrich]PQV42275.1 N2-methylguanosine tRNA methyltransferase [Methanohalophilus euhalobius]
MRYAFELSGDHEEIAADEALACLATEGLKPVYTQHYDHCLVVELEEPDAEIRLEKFAGKLAMCHHILRVTFICNNEPETIISSAENCDIKPHLSAGQTFVVRARKVNHHTTVEGSYLEQRVGGAVFRKGYRANLNQPDVTLRLILTEKCVCGCVIASIDRKAFHARAPHKKPFFYPGVLMPITARALVNLAGVNKDTRLLDPFCGTAGILVEAAMLGSRVIGLEARNEIIQGAKMNLEYFGGDYNLLQGDACKLPLKNSCIDSVITDPPYGRSAMIKAESIRHLYEESFAEMYRVLKPSSKAVIVSEMEINRLALDAGFTIVKQYSQRIHRSLTRNITILQKNNQ